LDLIVYSAYGTLKRGFFLMSVHLAVIERFISGFSQSQGLNYRYEK